MSTEDLGHCVVLEEVESHDPTDEEVELYAASIGINPKENPELLYIAREGVTARVPEGWTILQNRNGQIFYQQNSSGICVWQHPLDSYYRSRVKEALSKGASGQPGNSPPPKPKAIPATGSKQVLSAKSKEASSAPVPVTPVKTETIYQALPAPRKSPSVDFKTPSRPSVPRRKVGVPPQSPTTLPSPDQDSRSGSAAVSFSAINLPHVHSSPTGNASARRVLSESNASGCEKQSVARRHLNHHHHHSSCHHCAEGDENADPTAEALVNQFASSLRISTGRERRASRRLFDDSAGLNSCLYSPPDSPPPIPTQPSAAEAGSPFVEFDGNASLRFMLEEQNRLQEKLAFLKLTYKAYKLRLAHLNSSIKMLCSTAASAAAHQHHPGAQSPSRVPKQNLRQHTHHFPSSHPTLRLSAVNCGHSTGTAATNSSNVHRRSQRPSTTTCGAPRNE
ncbi:unnamed protein product [Mesocestoides corti]|uniref:WW domain-containing protein n=1 Tax=Mesocestoides corti TaxID=53468 RepID=A0A0R3UP60_MESCO|nr:unnamed protein product [Mesocestoides corti]